MFGHLHVVFRDWQAADRDHASVYQHLFGLEKNTEGAIRDQIRKDILSNFESVTVWLFDAPSDSTAALKTELTISKTSVLFRKQVRELRASLSQQLKTPTLFAGRAMTGRTIGPLVALVCDSLNKGETVMPHSAYVSMMRCEIDQVKQKLEVSMRNALDAQINSISAQQTEFSSEKNALLDFNKVLSGLAAQFNRDCTDTVGDLTEDMR